VTDHSAPDEVFLTGGTGFIGSHVLHALLKKGFRVRALVRPGSSRLASGNGYTIVEGDLRQAGLLVDHLRGCRYLIHTAALYSFRQQDRRAIWETNVLGTAAILEAARIAGIEKAVVTSSSSTLETFDKGAYHGSKVEQERVALAAQIPVVLVLPTAPVGPGDWKPTPTGQMIVDFIRGRIFGSVAGGMNVVPVEDVARAHLAALTRGRPGERYVVGSKDMTFDELWQVLARVAGRPAPRLRIPHRVALTLGLVDGARCRLFPAAQPRIPLEGVRMARHHLCTGAMTTAQDLGYEPTPVEDALSQAVTWYREFGYA
jgi:dihydroflavonol-4-reductase